MSFILKLINSPDDTSYYEIKYNLHNTMTLKLLYELFNFLGLSFDDLINIKFIIDAEQIKHGEEYNIIDAKDKKIYVFTMDEDIKLRLYDIFIKEGYQTNYMSYDNESDEDTNDTTQYNFHNNKNKDIYAIDKYANIDTDPDTNVDTDPDIDTDIDIETDSDDENLEPVDSYICAPITQTPCEPEPVPTMTPEVITSMNIKAVSLFSNPDFKNLIRIYMTKPELFKIFAKYIQHGDIIANDQIIKSIVDLDEAELVHYQGLADQIHALGLELPNELIINQLIKYSGHLNLTVRSLLSSI